MRFFVCFVKTRKKLDKYFKVNRIRNKQIIDIRKIIDEENIVLSNRESLAFFKVLIWNKIKTSKEKGKDVYYIPNFHNQELDILRVLSMKDKLIDDESEFNLLLFFDEFLGTDWLDDLMDNLDVFDRSQIMRDY